MKSRIAPKELKFPVTGKKPRMIRRRLPGVALGTMLGALLSTLAFAGGVDVSNDVLYSDDVTLTTVDGLKLDINGDTFMDLAVASNRTSAQHGSRYYLGNGDGTFQTEPVLLEIEESSEILAADLNNDGNVDLVQGRRDFPSLFYLGNGTGVGAATQISTDADRVLAMAAGDLDLDGDLDLVTGTGHAGGLSSNPEQQNRFYLNQFIESGSTTVTFATGADISTDPDPDDTRSIALADMDGDTDLDVIVGNDETTAGSNLVHLNQFIESGSTAVSFAAGINFGPADDQTSKVIVGDLNQDGLPDIVTLNNVQTGSSPGLNRYFRNTTTAGVFSLATYVDVSADTNRSQGGALADFDGDGDLDLAVANSVPTGSAATTSRNRLYVNQFIPNGSVSFAAGLDISVDEHQTRELAAGDINGDGNVDIVAGNQFITIAGEAFAGEDRRYLHNGTGTPFTNVAPVIDAQATLETDLDTPRGIVLADLTVTDPDNVYPADFTLTVQSGTDYTVEGNTITPAAGFVGNLTVPVTVNDGTDDSEIFELTVNVSSAINTAPIIDSAPILDATVGIAYSYTVTATDPDTGDTLTFSAPTLPVWLELTDNGDDTATLTGTPGDGDVGLHTVELEVSDGSGSQPGTQSFSVAVIGVVGNNAPSFDSSPVTDATVDAAYTYEVTATDPDTGATLAITAPTLPGWLTFTDNGDGTATLTGTPVAGDAGDHNVSLEVSDGAETDTQDFIVTVNTPPSFTSTAVTDAIEDAAYTYDVTATDADSGATLTITAPTLPAWLEFTDNGDGTATLTGTPASGDVGDHDVSLEVSDGTDTATQNFTITVAADSSTPPPGGGGGDDGGDNGGGGGGGGSLGFLSLFALLALGATRRRRRYV